MSTLILNLEVPAQWEGNVEGYMSFVVMQLRPLGHTVISWGEQ